VKLKLEGVVMAETSQLISEIVQQIDPSDEEKPAYEFSNGRKFVQPSDPYRPNVTE